MYIVQKWGDPWVPKPTTLEVPPWIAALGDVKLDDPTLWQDRNGFFHILAHNGDGPHPCGSHGAAGLSYRDGNPLPVGCSAHLYSRDALHWVMSPVAAHNATVELSGGGTRELYRQRPKVQVDKRGDVHALFGGVMPCGEAQIRGPGTAGPADPPASRRLGECTSDRPPPNPTAEGRAGSVEGKRSRIVSSRGQDNCWTGVVPLATDASRHGE